MALQMCQSSHTEGEACWWDNGRCTHHHTHTGFTEGSCWLNAISWSQTGSLLGRLSSAGLSGMRGKRWNNRISCPGVKYTNLSGCNYQSKINSCVWKLCNSTFSPYSPLVHSHLPEDYMDFRNYVGRKIFPWFAVSCLNVLNMHRMRHYAQWTTGTCSKSCLPLITTLYASDTESALWLQGGGLEWAACRDVLLSLYKTTF